ncbi:MAG: hypothetical protein ABW110_21965, partial [Steroidobacteraceae bacterium]
MIFQAGHQDLLGARKGTEPPSSLRVIGGFFVLSARPHAEFCVDDMCVRGDEFLRMKEGQSAAAGAP